MDWATQGLELMWIGGLAAVPVALLAGTLSRWRGCRPATRHAMWIAVLATFVAPMLSAGLWRPAWFRSERVLAAAGSLADVIEPTVKPERTVTISTPVADAPGGAGAPPDNVVDKA